MLRPFLISYLRCVMLLIALYAFDTDPWPTIYYATGQSSCPPKGSSCDFTSYSSFCQQDADGKNCKAGEYCGTFAGGNNKTGELYEIYLAKFAGIPWTTNKKWTQGYSDGWFDSNAANKGCESGASLVDSLDLVLATRAMFYDTSCFIFRYGTIDTNVGTVNYGSQRDVAVQGVVASNGCDGAFLSVSCKDNTNTVGVRYYKTRSDGSTNSGWMSAFGNPVCARKTPPRQWVLRDTTNYIEDLTVFARMPYTDAKAFCESNGGALFYGGDSDYSSSFRTSNPLPGYSIVIDKHTYAIFATAVKIDKFWVGVESGQWTLTGGTMEKRKANEKNKGDIYIMMITDQSGQFVSLGINGFKTRDGGLNVRFPFACSRYQVRMWMFAPALCFAGQPCGVTVFLQTPVTTIMDAAFIEYTTTDGSASVRILLGQSSGRLVLTPSVSGTYTVSKTRGDQIVSTNSTDVTVRSPYTTTVFDLPARFFRGQPCPFKISKETDDIVTLSEGSSFADKISGTYTFGSFTGRVATASFAASEVSTATRNKLAIRVVGACDCGGGQCLCYQTVSNTPIAVVEREVIGVSLGSEAPTGFLLGSDVSASIVVTTPPGLTVCFNTKITVSDSCGLRYPNGNQLDLVVGDVNLVKQVVVRPPTTAVTSLSQCVLSFTFSNGLQYSSVNNSALAVTLAPFLVPTIGEVSSSMTVGSDYQLTVSLADVYEGATIILGPTCTGVTFTPSLASFTKPMRSSTFVLRGSTAGSCTLGLNVGGSGANQVTLAGASFPTLVFSAELVVRTALSSSILYVGSAYFLTVSSDFTNAVTRLQIRVSWSGSLGAVNVSAIDIELSQSNPSISIPVLALGVSATGVGFTFTLLGQVSGYDPNIAGAIAEIRSPTVATISSGIIPFNMSIGSYYALSLWFTIEQLPPAGHSVSICVNYNADYFTVSPSCLNWASTEGFYTSKSVTIAATARTPSLASSPSYSGELFSYTVAGTHPRYKYGTFNISNGTHTFRRIDIQTPTAREVFGAGVVFSLPISLSQPTSLGDVFLTVSFPSDKVSGPTSAVIRMGEQSVTLRFTTLVATENSPAFSISYTLATDSGSTSSVTVATLESRINATSIRVSPYWSISFSCNSSALYYGPWNAILCTVSILALPPEGSLLVGPRFPDSNSPLTSPNGATSFASTASTSSPYILIFVFSPSLSYAFVDGALATLTMAVSDTSGRFNPADLKHTFSCRKLIGSSLSRDANTDVFIWKASTDNFFGVCVSLNEKPSEGELVVVSFAVPTMIAANSSVTFTSNATAPTRQCVTMRATLSGLQSITLSVAGSFRYSPTTTSLAVAVKELSTVALTSSLAVGRAVCFVGQTISLGYSLTEVPPEGKELNISAAMYCGGTEMPSIFSSSLLFANVASSTMSREAVALLPCPNGVYRAQLFGTVTSFDRSETPSIPIEVRPRKVIRVLVDKASVYGGAVDERFLSFQITDIPFASGSSLTLSIVSVPAGILTFQFDTLDFTTSSSPSSVNRTVTFRAREVLATTSVLINISFTGSASTEYTFVGGPPSSFSIDVLPIVKINYQLDFSPAVIYVSPQLTGTMSVSLPVTTSGNVIVTPQFLYGSPSSVRFTPASVILNASLRTFSFTVQALAATSSTEALTVTYSGSAVEYFPQPAAATYPVRFMGLGRVYLLEAVPASVFQGLTATLYVQLSYAVPADGGWASVVVNVASDNSALTVNPTSLSWTPGSNELQKQIVLYGSAIASGIKLTFSLAASTPPIYQSQLPTNTSLDVLSARAILWSVSSFVYVGRSVEGTLKIVKSPPSGTKLSLAIQTTDVAAVSVSAISDFDDTTALTRLFTVSGLQVRSLITLTVGINSGHANFDQPASRTIEVRALETVTVTGISSGGVYVGSTTVISITISRSVPCESGTLSIIPAFGTSDAQFSPTSGVTWAVGDSTLTKTVTLTASQVTAAAVGVSFPLSYGLLSCSGMYSPASLSASSVRIYPKDVVRVSTWDNMTASGGVSFVYVNNRIPLVIDLGVPAIRHNGVRIDVSFAGGSTFVAFSNSTVVFPPGVNTSTIWVNGLLEVSPADIVLTIAPANSNAFSPPATPMRIRVLRQIAVTIRYSPSNPLLVVGVPIDIEVNLDGAAQVGSVTIGFTYAGNGPSIGPNSDFTSTNVSFEARTTFLTGSLTFTALRPSDERPLQLVFSGPAGTFFYAPVPFYMSRLLAQRYVEIAAVPSELFLGSPNAQTLTVRLKTRPTLGASDVITVLLPSSLVVSYSAQQIQLTDSNPEVTVVITGTSPGTVILRDSWIVASASREYAVRINNTVQSSTVAVKSLLVATLANYLSTMYTDESQTFTVTIPRIPQSGLLSVRPTLSGTSYPLIVTPSIFVFTSTSGLTATFTITTISTTMPQVMMQILSSGSSEYASIVASSTLRVNPATQISISDFLPTVYIGSTNRFTFSVSIARRPQNNQTISLGFGTSPHYSFVPQTVEFGPQETHPRLVVPVVVYGLTASGRSLPVPVTLTDPTNWYDLPAQQSLEVLRLENYSASIDSQVIYQGSRTRVRLFLTKIPVGPMTVQLTMMKNRSSTSMYVADPSLYSVSPSATQTLSGVREISFEITALAAPESIQVGFVTSGTPTSQFFIMTLPTFVVRFVPLMPILATVPPKLYLGLPTQIQISIPTAPTSGSLRLTISSDTSIAFPFLNLEFTPTTPIVQNLTVTANVRGSFSVGFSAQNIDTNAYMSSVTPSQWNVVVEDPYPLNIYDPPEFVYAYTQNSIMLRIDYGTLLAGETVSVVLTHNATDADGLGRSPVVIFPQSLDIPASSASFTVYTTRPIFVSFNVTFTSNARRLVLSPRLLREGAFVINFRPLKTILASISTNTAVVGQQVPVSVLVSPPPSRGHTLYASLAYSGSPSNIQLPALGIMWQEGADPSPRNMFFSGISPTTVYERITVLFAGDPQYNLSSMSFEFKFNSLWRVTPSVPIIMYKDVPTLISFTLETTNPNNAAVLVITPSLSIFGSIKFMRDLYSPVEDSPDISIKSRNFVSVYAVPTRESRVTMSYALTADDAYLFGVPPPSTIQIVANNTVIVDASSQNLVVYIAPSDEPAITVPIRIKIFSPPRNGTLVVTPTLMCSSGQFVEFTPKAASFNSSNASALQVNVSIRGTAVSAPCELGFALSGTTSGFSGTPQSFMIETRNPHPITLKVATTTLFIGTENRVALNVSLDPSAVMPLSEDITITFTVDPSKAPCVTVNPRVLFWARGVAESLSKIAFIEATCAYGANIVTIDVKKPVFFSNTVPKSITMESRNLLQVSVVDASRPTSTDYFMYVGGAALDLDATITEPLSPTESLTVTPVYRGSFGSVSIADAIWPPSPLATLTKKVLLQAYAISPAAPISFVVTGPPRFNRTATGSGTLEVFGLKKIVAVLPDSLLVGQEYLSRVTIETRPDPGETIIVQPVWEGQPDALSWTPPYLVWTGSSIKTEEFFRITAKQFSQPYNFVVRVTGSYRYVRTAYSSTLSILRPQRIVSTQLPFELMRDTRYAIGIDIGTLPAGENDVLFVRMQPEVDELGIECIVLDASELTFTRYVRNQLSTTEQLVGVTVRRVCSQRYINFQILGSAITQYDQSIIPRAFVTLPKTFFAIDWPSDQYVGVENAREVVISMLETFYDELSFANVSIQCNGSVVYQSNLSWVYGSRSQISFMMYNLVPEVVVCNFVVESNTIVNPFIPNHTTVFNRFISISRFNLASEIYVGDTNKVKLRFNVSSLPLILDGEPAAVFYLNATTNAGGITVIPSSLRWSADSPLEQFIYVIGDYPTSSPVKISFIVTGEGAELVEAIPPPLFVKATPLLLINYDVAPSGLYVGAANRMVINVTVPDTLDNITMTVAVEGETSGFILNPTILKFKSGGRAWQSFAIEGVYPTSRVSYLKYTIEEGPPRITPRPMSATESIFAIGLEPVTRTPSGTSFILFEEQTQIFTFDPPMPGIFCWSSDNSIVVQTSFSNDTLRVTPQRAATALINCSWPDTTRESMVPFTVVSRNRKTITPPKRGSAYLGVSTGTRIPFSISGAPLGRMFIVAVHYNNTFVTVIPPQLSFIPTSATTQFFTVTGVSLTPSEGTKLTFTYSGENTVHEYVTPKPEDNLCAFRVIEKLIVTHCGGPSCVSTDDPVSNKSIVGYIGAANNIRVTFRAPQPTLYTDIRIWPDAISSSAGIIFCSQISSGSCIPINQANPLLLTTSVSEVVALAFAFNSVSNVPLVFDVYGPQDYVFTTTHSMRVGFLTLKPLEKVIVGVESLRHELYVGSANQQQVPITITAAPNVVGHNVEVATRAPAAVTVNPPLITWTTTAAGMNTAMTQYVTFRGDETKLGKNYTVTFGWRDRLSTTTAINFQDAFTASSFYFDVLPLIGFSIIVDGATPAPQQLYDMYLGEINAKSISIALERLPVFVTSEVSVRVILSNPDCFAASETQFKFSRLQYPDLTRTLKVWAKQLYDGTNNTLTLQLVGTSEYRDMRHQIRLKGNALLKMRHDLTLDTIAVGTENAISFLLWPPIPSDLTLGSLVTCGEVSFTAAELLKWENSMEPKQMTVAGTYPTTAISNCYLQTPIMAGASSTQFIAPPLSIKMSTRARPRILASPPDGIAGTSVRDAGINFVISLSEGGFWKWNTTHSDFNSLINSGVLRLHSSRDAGAEPNSIMSFLNRQMAGQLGNPFFIATFDTLENTLTIKMGPHASFYSSARETISLYFSRWVISSGVTIDPAFSAIHFEVRGRKESLMGSSSNVLGSGAASAALAGGALSIGAATAAGKLQSIMNSFLCPNPDWKDNQDSMDWTDAPIVVSLGTNAELGTYAGAALMNLILIFGLGLFHLFVAYLVYLARRRRSYRDKSFAAARAVVRFPSLILFPVLFLYQAIISSSLKVVLYSPLSGLRVLCAFLFVSVGFGVPGVIFSMIGPGFTAIYRTRDEEDAAKGVVRRKPTGAQFIVRWLFQPTGHWHHEDPYWLHAYGMVFDEFQWRAGSHFEWFVLVDVVVTFILGLADGIEPEDLTQCYGRLIVSVIAFFLQFFLIVLYRPYVTRFLNVFFAFVYFLQFMSMLLVAIAVLNNTPQYDGVKIAVNLLLFFSCLLMLKSLIDVGLLINEYFGISEMFLADDRQELAYRDLNAKEENEVESQVLDTLFKDNGDVTTKVPKGRNKNKNRNGGGKDVAVDDDDDDKEGGDGLLAVGLLLNGSYEENESENEDEELGEFPKKATKNSMLNSKSSPLYMDVKSDVIYKGGALLSPPPIGTRERFEYDRKIRQQQEQEGAIYNSNDEEAEATVNNINNRGRGGGGRGEDTSRNSGNNDGVYRSDNNRPYRGGGRRGKVGGDADAGNNPSSTSSHYFDDDDDDDTEYSNYNEGEGHNNNNNNNEGTFDPSVYFGGKYRLPRNAEEAAETEYRRARGLLEVDAGYRSVPRNQREPRISEQLRSHLADQKVRFGGEEEGGRGSRRGPVVAGLSTSTSGAFGINYGGQAPPPRPVAASGRHQTETDVQRDTSNNHVRHQHRSVNEGKERGGQINNRSSQWHSDNYDDDSSDDFTYRGDPAFEL